MCILTSIRRKQKNFDNNFVVHYKIDGCINEQSNMLNDLEYSYISSIKVNRHSEREIAAPNRTFMEEMTVEITAHE